MEREIAGPADDHTRRPGAPAGLMRLGTPGRRDRRAWSALRWEVRAVPPTCTTSLICRNLRRRLRSGHSAALRPAFLALAGADGRACGPWTGSVTSPFGQTPASTSATVWVRACCEVSSPQPGLRGLTPEAGSQLRCPFVTGLVSRLADGELPRIFTRTTSALGPRTGHVPVPCWPRRRRQYAFAPGATTCGRIGP